MAGQKIIADDTSILSKLKDMFFKGLDKILSGAMEYKEDDDGVVHCEIALPVLDSEGVHHDLKLILTPIENKEDVYYVQVDKGDIADLDVQGLDGMTFKINDASKDAFNKVIDSMLSNNELEKYETEEDASAGASTAGNSGSTTFTAYAETSEPVDGKYPMVTVTTSLKQAANGQWILTFISDNRSLSEPTMTKKYKSQPSAAEINKFKEEYMDENGLVDTSESDGSVKQNTSNTSQDAEESDDEVMEELGMSSKIHCTLHKVTSSEGVSIDLVAIDACKDISAAIDLIEELVNDDSAIEGLEDGDTSIILTELNDNELDAEVTDEQPDIAETYMQIFESGIEATDNIEALKYTFVDLYFEDYVIRDVMEAVARLIVASGQRVPNRNTVSHDVPDLTNVQSREEAVELYSQIISKFARLVDGYYCNLPHNIQELAARLLDARDRAAALVTSAVSTPVVSTI